MHSFAHLRSVAQRSVGAGVALAMVFVPARAAECVAADPPQSWRAPTSASPIESGPGISAIPPLDLVLLRHGEKPLRHDGVMIEDGNLGAGAARRLLRLPDRLLHAFGCPDLIVTANPAVKMVNKRTGTYFNYVRPMATIAPLAIRLNFPIWSPYGYNETGPLARDLLGDKAFAPGPDAKPRTIFVAWERTNIRTLYENLLRLGRLRTPDTGEMTVDGKTFRCAPPPDWKQCDFDSIWLIHIRDGALCLTHERQQLDTPAFMRRCVRAESATDTP